MVSQFWLMGYEEGTQDFSNGTYDSDRAFQRLYGPDLAHSAEGKAAADDFHHAYTKAYYELHQQRPDLGQGPPAGMYEGGEVEYPDEHRKRVFLEGLDHIENPWGEHPPHNPEGVGQSEISVE